MRIATLISLAAVLACSGKEPRAAAPPAPPPTSASVTLPQFQNLRWLQGTWRGSGEATTPFYESYLFLDDSTIRSFAYADSTLALANDSGMIRWSGGEVRSASGAMEWLVSEFDSTHVRFEPLRNAVNSFTWTPSSLTEWRATLQFRDANGVERSRVYQMQRVGS